MSDDTNWRDGVLAALRDEQSWQSALDSLALVPPEERARRIDARMAGALVLLLGDPSRTRQRRAADALKGLVADTPALADALQSALTALDPRLRWGAAYTIGHALHPPAENLWPAVRETLSLDDGDQRWAAAELTCELARHHPTVRDDVLAAVSEGSATMRRMLLYCLRDLEDPDLRGVVEARLEDEDAGVRLAALSAGVQAVRPGAETATLAARIAPLVASDPDLGVRRAAAATLGRLGDPTASTLETLENARASNDESLVRAAAAALARLAPDSEQN